MRSNGRAFHPIHLWTILIVCESERAD